MTDSGHHLVIFLLMCRSVLWQAYPRREVEFRAGPGMNATIIVARIVGWFVFPVSPDDKPDHDGIGENTQDNIDVKAVHL